MAAADGAGGGAGGGTTSTDCAMDERCRCRLEREPPTALPFLSCRCP